MDNSNDFGAFPSFISWDQNLYIQDTKSKNGICLTLAFDFLYEYFLAKPSNEEEFNIWFQKSFETNIIGRLQSIIYRHNEYTKAFTNIKRLFKEEVEFIRNLYEANTLINVVSCGDYNTAIIEAFTKCIIDNLKFSNHFILGFPGHAASLIRIKDIFYFFEPNLGIYKIPTNDLKSFFAQYIKQTKFKRINIVSLI